MMMTGDRIVYGFLVVGVGAVLVSGFMVRRISRPVDEIQRKHTPALESILSVKGTMADGVQESLAYLVSRDAEEKEDSLAKFDDLNASLRVFADVAQIDARGEEQERAILMRLVRLNTELEDNARVLFRELEQTGTVDRATFVHYEAVIDQAFAAYDELIALEHDEVHVVQQIAVSAIQSARHSLWGVAATVLLLALIVAIVMRRWTLSVETARAEQMVLRDRFVERTLAVQDRERRRIARELHDETGQALAALAVGLRTLSMSPDLSATRESAQRLEQTAESLIHGIGRLVKGLHPQVIEDHGLVPALQQLATETQEAHGIQVDLDVVGDSRQFALDPDRTLGVYRVVQEALTNVARHAAATRVGVFVRHSDGQLRVMIEDNGRGFDTTRTTRQGLGLHGMQERAAALQARWILESEPGVGTRVAVDLPLFREMR